ncbi:uncharacterized protein LOC135092991 [Scylla paramamosain]|uniref:uncharacterized protein LOC135092991 n=1 Tax=Scylla paramamosain TaxID=85552 RepID=UPI0030830931
MNLPMFSSVFIIFAAFSLIHGWILQSNKANKSSVHDTYVTNAILKATAEDFIVLLVKKKTSQQLEQTVTTAQLRATRGVVVFQVSVDDQDDVSQSGLAWVVAKARQVRRTSHNVLVLVQSDDAAFLSAFAQWTLKGRLLVWATRLLVVSSLRLQSVQFLHKVLSLSNSLLLTLGGSDQRVSLSAVLPYSEPGSEPVLVAHWSPHRGLSVAAGAQLFPEKFKKITSSIRVFATMIEDATHKPALVADPSAPGGQRLVFTGPMIKVLDYVARGLNFSYGFKQSPDGTYGGRNTDGSWTGMVGQVFREEADLGLGPFAMTPVRAEDVDFTTPVKIFGVRILAGQGKLKVDPWGFVLPLTPTVWIVSLASLLLLPGLMFLLISLISRYNRRAKDWTTLQYQFLSIFLQEGM